MKAYLLSYRIKGIKNITKDLVFEFYNKKISKNIDFQEYNVKAIYGENGVGKSGVINSVKILKNLMINRRYLLDSLNISVLNDIVNVKSRCFEIEAQYLVIREKQINIYKYVVSVSRDHDDSYKIIAESLYNKKISSKSWRTIYSVIDGDIKETYDKKITNSILSSYGKNSLLEQTLLCCYLSYRNEIRNTDAENEYIYFEDSLLFADSIYVYLEDSDKYKNEKISTFYELTYTNGETKIFSIPKESNRAVIDPDIIDTNVKVRASDYHQFNKDVNRITNFIKIFKPELLNIEIVKRIEKDEYNCELVFDYGDYKINSKFESNGVKKLIRLYKAIDEIDNGKIVFIDEFDSNIHDVYLCKLIEYIENYAQGQLCFTSQSVTPMEVLEDRKKSIDFITRQQEVVSWVKNSHYSAPRLYKKGFIDKMPFNIEDFEFSRAFGSIVDE